MRLKITIKTLSRFRVMPQNNQESCCTAVNYLTPFQILSAKFCHECETLRVLFACASIWNWQLCGKQRGTDWPFRSRGAVKIPRWERGSSRYSAILHSRLLHQTRPLFFLLFFPPGLIFLEPAGEYWANFVCVCVEQNLHIWDCVKRVTWLLPPTPKAQPTAHLWAGWKGK